MVYDELEAYDNAGLIFNLEPKIIKSLTKSRVKKSIILYLYKIYPQPSYAAKIARNVNANAINVIGGLKGTGKRYNSYYSLLRLGIILAERNEDSIYYKLSLKGIQVAENLLKNNDQYKNK